MKRFNKMVMGSALLVMIALSFLFVFSSCKKDHFDNTGYVAPTAGMMAYNLAPDQPNVAVEVAGERVGYNVLGYTAFTGTYLPFYIGTKEVRFFDYASGSTLAYNTVALEDSNYYSSFLMGNAGNYRNVIVNDNLAPLTVIDGKAWIRFVNAIPDSTTDLAIQIRATAGNNLDSAVRYGTVSGFVPVNAGDVNISISNSHDVAANRTISLTENKVYTLLFVGLPNPPDTIQAAQIRYVQNGFVTP